MAVQETDVGSDAPIDTEVDEDDDGTDVSGRDPDVSGGIKTCIQCGVRFDQNMTLECPVCDAYPLSIQNEWDDS